MATGTGKTVVMAALILYHYFNRQEYRQDTRFCDYYLLVAPGITIKDRLGVCLWTTPPTTKTKRRTTTANATSCRRVLKGCWMA